MKFLIRIRYKTDKIIMEGKPAGTLAEMVVEFSDSEGCRGVALALADERHRMIERFITTEVESVND